eukprot:2423672-Lingulodinium_polyedra.AAC.1
MQTHILHARAIVFAGARFVGRARCGTLVRRKAVDFQMRVGPRAACHAPRASPLTSAPSHLCVDTMASAIASASVAGSVVVCDTRRVDMPLLAP